jgi:hypothetical protein
MRAALVAAPAAPAARVARPLAIAALACVVLAGCLALPGGRTVARRRVAQKVADSLLVADDYSRCAVSSQSFAEIRVGERRWCTWRHADALPEADEVPRTPRREPPRPTVGAPRRP